MSRDRIASLLRLYDACRNTLYPILEDISDDHLAWRPAPDARSIREQMRHLIRVDTWYMRQLGLDPPLCDPGDGAPSAALAEGMQGIQGYVRGQLETCERDEDLAAERQSPKASKPYTLGWVTQHIAQHYLYHHAQMVYLRRAQDRNWASPLLAWEHATEEIGRCIVDGRTEHGS
jgi:uncharacterized damage-inducible protein DinB